MTCFVAQQIAEKALKAFLYAQGEEIVVGHSVEALYRWATGFDADFGELHEAAAPLDGYYVPTLYPNSLPDSIPARVYTRKVAEEVPRISDHVLHLVQGKLKEKPNDSPLTVGLCTRGEGYGPTLGGALA